MKSIILATVIALTIAPQKCKKNAVPAIPACVQSKIDAIKKEPRWNPPAKVEEYRYDGRSVFLFSSNCCDQFNEAFDDSCNYVCAPSGGMTGKGDRKCTDFKDAAQFVKLVWQDER